MRIQLYDIVPALQPYIKLICAMECDEEADTQHIRVLPDTCVELFVNYTSSPVAIIDNKLHKRSIITFRMSRHTDVQMRKGAGCLAICFYPGMACSFFQVPMNLLTDTTLALSDIWHEMATEIEDRLAGSLNDDERVEIVQKCLLQQLVLDKHDVHVAYCLSRAQLSGGLMSVSMLANDTGLSQRHLSRKFQHCVGLSPKEYLRVCRFIRSLDHLKKYPEHSLTEVAYESGYYDQAHFNRDYRTYTGHTPAEVANSQYILY
ncbi:AraC-like DNA-binding protein [Pedobacter sp. AK017]|uniref:AraC family transcriptional regulator n=1 Tax=Pedobacter sp. AK017 TaxID=2723073 RepID=UPI0016230590|nr:helix-turn-helix domain-containing protein [Pedobacter sp. AK017]MBB5438287.1 AraC-like DNA-binding protein [Pedobacter sp. AK017]